ncbi:hypothetical protein ACFVXG_40190 [Kitasatospora sp. NPDC058162]|uniref:hypothetical protein n=1 Tax=Kitasatospora sp. NPDC058162 TaxID=3346362 RepID=UPI0036DB35B1
MFPSDAPPLPSAAPLTAAAAANWRAARTAWRLDSRWLALAPLAFLILAAAVEPENAGRCNDQGICREPWGETLAIWTVLAEAVLLAARIRPRLLVPPVALALLWYVPDGLVTPTARWSAVLLNLLLTAVLLRAETGRRNARRQLDELMAPPVPFPWTAAGAPSPVRSNPPVVRRVLGGVLLLVALVPPLYGLWAQARQDAAFEQAARVTATAGTADQDGVLTVRFQPPGGGPERTAALDVRWARQPQPGEPVPLQVDGDSVRAVGDGYDLSDQLTLGGLLALFGVLLLASAAAAEARRTRPAFEGSAPALAVRVRTDVRGDLLVLPLDGPPDGPALWRVVERDRYLWSPDGGPDGEGPGWVPDETDDDEEDCPGPAQLYDGRDEEQGELYYRATPARAAERMAGPGEPVPAVLYRGPDGPDRQLLVRPALLDGDPQWGAAVVVPAAKAPRPHRKATRLRRDELAVAALTAETVAAAPAPGPEARRLAARRWEIPPALRVLPAPAMALLLAAAVVYLSGDDWWEGLVRPLWLGSSAILGSAHALSWQLVADRDGLRVATALRTRSYRWQQISAAAVHRHRLTIRLRGGDDLAIGGRALSWLARRLDERYDPAELARAVATAAHRPDLRPDRALPDRLGSPQHLVNTLSLAGFVLFTVVHHML